MNECKVCGISPIKFDDDRFCNNCQKLGSMAENFIHTNPEKARVFFRDLVIKAGQTLRARASI